MGIPNVLDALGLIVDSLTLEGDSQGRIAIDLPENYDWDRVEDFFNQLSKEELVDFCYYATSGEAKENLLEEFGEEADYAQEALIALVRKLKGETEDGGTTENKKKRK
jgi:uncharacterized protein (DUF3820 family)